MTSIAEEIGAVADDMALLPDWEERIAHIIEMARTLAPLEEAERNEETRVRGCVSRVWLVTDPTDNAGKLHFRGDSDAHLVRGEIALLLRIFSGRTPQEILSVDPKDVFERLGLKDALTMQRSNGLFSMMNRIQAEARRAMSA
jgi:cysteine desulfuration protein SufE